MLASGEAALAAGAVAAGCGLLAVVSDAPQAWGSGLLLLKAGSEREAAHLALGASFAGARAAAVLPGPRLPSALEALHLASATETPLVMFALGELSSPLSFDAGPDCPALLLKPLSPLEAFQAAAQAFNLADRWQCPVVVACSAAVLASAAAFKAGDLETPVERGLWADPEPQPGFDRYAETETGISPRAVPCQEGLVFAAPADAGSRLALKRSRKMRLAVEELRTGKLSAEETPCAAPLPVRTPAVAAQPLPPEAYGLPPEPGGAASGSLARALGRLCIQPKDALLVSGPGCPKELLRLRVFRLAAPAGALAAAAGAKLANPNLSVVASLDASREETSLLASARRDADILCLSFGGPSAALLALYGGCRFVARIGPAQDGEDILRRAAAHKGFSFVEFADADSLAAGILFMDQNRPNLPDVDGPACRPLPAPAQRRSLAEAVIREFNPA
ncbi:MAG: hypothetical protein HY922_10635 [Elusimicrobia bacterium]|nr:hypothetical protein [Elusimicrobiota bacterium]